LQGLLTGAGGAMRQMGQPPPAEPPMRLAQPLPVTPGRGGMALPIPQGRMDMRRRRRPQEG
jgi:hypothetical protein